MAEVIALPARGDVFFDPRGSERSLRVSWHTDAKLVVLSLWREGTCVGTFQMPAEDVPHLVGALVEGLAECLPDSPSIPRPGPRPDPGPHTGEQAAVRSVTSLTTPRGGESTRPSSV
jgi:hypothetical protein